MVKSTVTSPAYRWVILAVAWMSYIVAFMQRLSIGPLAPFLKDELGLTSTEVGFFVSAAAFGYMATLIPAGWLADRIGVRWILLIGEVVGGIFTLCMFTVNTFTQGMVIMVLGGMGMGCLMPSTTKAILEWFPMKERATAMGLKQTGINLSGIIMASTLPAVALALGWKAGFVGIGLISIVGGIVSFFLYKQPPPVVNYDPRVPTVSTSAMAPRPKTSLREVLWSRDIWLVAFAAMCLSVVEFSVSSYFVLYLKESLLFSVVAAGFILAILHSGGAFGKPINGVISDRLLHGSRKKLFIMVCSLAFIMCLVFAFLPQGSLVGIIVVFSLLLGLAGTGWGGLHLTLIGEFAGSEHAGTVTGICQVVTMLGNVLGPPVFGYILDSTGSYRIGWQFLAVLAILAAVLLVFVRESRRRI